MSKIKKRFLFINLKSYKKSIKDQRKIIDALNKLIFNKNLMIELNSKKTNLKIIILPNSLMLGEFIKELKSVLKYKSNENNKKSKLDKIKNRIKIEVFSQHSDPVEASRNTGFIAVEDLKVINAKGSLLNHSEHKIKKETIFNTLKLLNRFKLESIVCLETPKKIESFINDLKKNKLNIEYIAIEPKDLIATKNSITKTKPHYIIKSKDFLNKNKVNSFFIVGAGLHSFDDIKEAIKLGADGVLIASDFVNSRDKYKKLIKYVNALIE